MGRRIRGRGRKGDLVRTRRLKGWASFVAAACYLAAGVVGAVAAALLASPASRAAAAVVGAVAGIVVVWLAALFTVERVRRRARPPARGADDPYYAQLSAFVYGRGRNTRRLVVVLVLVITVGLVVDLLATFG